MERYKDMPLEELEKELLFEEESAKECIAESAWTHFFPHQQKAIYLTRLITHKRLMENRQKRPWPSKRKCNT